MSDTNPESEILQEIESMQPNTDLITNAPEGSQLISGEIEGGLFSTIISILKKLLFWQTETDETLKTHRHDSDYEPKDPSLQAQKHTHGNKSTLDKITLAMVNTWNALVSFPGFAANGSATAGKAVEATDNRLSNARPPTAHSHTNADLPPYPTLSSLGGATAGHNHDSTYEPKDATLQAQKHTHGNKSVLDQISTALFTKWCTLISFPGFAANGSATAGKAVEATDSRLSDARPPTAHSHTNADLPPYPTLAGLGGAAANHNHDASYEAKDTSLQAQKHTHSNKSVLDGITSVLINKWNALISFPGFATNGSATAGKAVEATDGRLSNARTPTAHTHAIGDLPAYPTLSSLGGATANHNHDASYEPKDATLQSQKHTHSNKSVLDGITSVLINKWNALISFPGFATNGSATAGKAVEATDSRLSNARTPTAHTHAIGDLPAYPTLSSLGGAAENHSHQYAERSHYHNMYQVIDYGYAICSTTPTQNVKYLSNTYFPAAITRNNIGATIHVYFSLPHTGSSLSLCINNGPIINAKYKSGNISNGLIFTGTCATFVLDGLDWQMIGEFGSIDKKATHIVRRGFNSEINASAYYVN